MERYVDLGRRRNPSLEGTSGLLEKALGKGSSFDLVQFTYYKEELGSIRQAIANEKGSMNWVIGARGTGKSEVLNHLFSSSIQSNPQNCRLPLYISVSGGEAHGEVNIELIDRLTQKAVIDAFDYLVDNQPEGFITHLQERLESGNWAKKDSALRKKIESPNFVFEEMLKGLEGSGIGIALIIDDMDKISTESAITFYSESQTFFQVITDQRNLTVVSSVTHDFMEQARTTGSMDYCVSRSRNKSDELRVPDLSDLAASDTQDFINDRLRYLHWDGERWIWHGEMAPQFNTAGAAISHANWGTYDITQMRRNGALLVLLGWLKKKGSLHLSLRQVITELETILSDDKRKATVLVPDDVDRILRSNNHEEKELIEKSLISLVRKNGVNEEQIMKEINLLYTLQKYPKFWIILKDIIMDRVTLGQWKGAAYKASRQQRLELSDEDKSELENWKSNAALLKPFVDNPDAALNTILEWVSGVVENQTPPEGVFATTVDEWMSHLSGRFLIRVLEKAMLDIKASGLEEEPLEKPKVATPPATPNTVLVPQHSKTTTKLDLESLTPVERSWVKANEATGATDIRDLDAKERQAVGAHFALYLCQEILKNQGRASRFIKAVEENFYEAQKAFCKNFLSWLVLSVNPYNKNQKDKFNVISAYINGTKQTESDIPRLNTQFNNITSQPPLTPAGWSYLNNANHRAAIKPPKPFEYKINVHNEPLDLVNAIIRPKDTIASFSKNQTITIEVSITKENWNHHVDNTGIPANILPHLEQLLQWTNNIDDMIDKEMFKYKGQAHKLLDDIMEEVTQNEQLEFDEFFGGSGMKMPIFDSFRINEISIRLPIPREDLLRSMLAGAPSAGTIVQSRENDNLSDIDVNTGMIPFVSPNTSFTLQEEGIFKLDDKKLLSFHRNHDSIGLLFIEAESIDGHRPEKIVFQRRPRLHGRRMKEIMKLNKKALSEPENLFRAMDHSMASLAKTGTSPEHIEQIMMDFVEWAKMPATRGKYSGEIAKKLDQLKWSEYTSKQRGPSPPKTRFKNLKGTLPKSEDEEE